MTSTTTPPQTSTATSTDPSTTGRTGLGTVLITGGSSGLGAATVQVSTGRGRLITLARPMSDVFVANDGVADVQVRSPTQIYVFGKKAGETTVSATAKGGAVVFTTTVRVGNNLGSVGDMLALAMPDAKIVATPIVVVYYKHLPS